MQSHRRAWAGFLAVIFAIAPVRGAPAPAGGTDGTDGTDGELPIPWSSVDEAERRLVARLLESSHWPMRALALVRLERYAGPERAPLVRARVVDEAWQVRCFALRSAHRLGVAVAPETLAEESDGRVIRAALTYGVTLDEKRLERSTRRLMRASTMDEQVLGLEIAAASDVVGLRREATRRVQRVFRRMDEALFLRVSRRLARIVGRDDDDLDSIPAWQAWFAARDGKIELAPPAASRPAPPSGELPLVARLDVASFSRLLDYLDALRTRDLDVAIVMDVTTSMVPMINEARAGVESLILFLDDVARTMRLALIAYRDHDNPPVWEGERLTKDVASIRDFLYRIRITGGRDLPEAVLQGLTACGDMKWSREASRQIILVGDARPHTEDVYKINGLLENYRTNGIVVHAVHVPMVIHPMQEAQLPPDLLAFRKAEIADHNVLTAEAFAEIASEGGGEMVTLERAHELVPSIMHLTIERAWWRYFDEFYGLYLDLCR